MTNHLLVSCAVTLDLHYKNCSVEYVEQFQKFLEKEENITFKIDFRKTYIRFVLSGPNSNKVLAVAENLYFVLDTPPLRKELTYEHEQK